MNARVPSWSAALAALLLALCTPSAAARAPSAAQAKQPSESEQKDGAQEDGEPSSHEKPPADPLGRGSPRGAIKGFLEAARQRDYERAARYLDLSGVPEADGPTRARQLKLVLDRLVWVDPDAMSSSARGKRGDDLEPELERIAGAPQEGMPEVSFFLERGPRDGESDPTPIWRVAPSTLERVPELYAQFGPGVVAEILPPTFIEVSFLEVYLWQWIGLILLVVGAYLAGWIAASVVARILHPIVSRSRSTLDDHLVELLIGPLRLAVAVGAFAASLPLLRLSVPAEEFLHGAVKVLTIVALTWLVFRAIDLFAGHTRRSLLERGQESAVYLIPLGSKALKLVLAVLVLLSALQTFGFDVTALVAGLGVGGLAVALALRPTLENVFGGIAVLVDEPVRPGQFCKFGDQVGTVEEVGLRSTRIRTLSRTVVSVPNSEFANMRLENFAKRDRMWLQTTLGLRYETTAEQLRHVTAELKRTLLSHPKVLPDPLRVRFLNFGAYSLDLDVFAYVDTADYNEFLEVKEDLFLRIIDVVEASGTGFAFPSNTTYLARDGGLDEEKAEAAAEEVQRWRAERALPFPNFSSEAVERMRGTLDWPPRGSPDGEPYDRTGAKADAPGGTGGPKRA